MEANYVEHFSDVLPSMWGGFGVSANWTWVQSNYEIRPGENSVLPSTSKNTGNAALLYDLHPVNLSLGAYYVSGERALQRLLQRQELDQHGAQVHRGTGRRSRHPA